MIYMDITEKVNKCCEELAARQELITSKRVQQELLFNDQLDKNAILSQAHKIPKLISTWRIIKLKNSKENNTEFYQTLQMPDKIDKEYYIELQNKIFSLEYELYQYKHATLRANNKVKCLEKKLYSYKGQIVRERQNVITCLREMLN